MLPSWLHAKRAIKSAPRTPLLLGGASQWRKSGWNSGRRNGAFIGLVEDEKWGPLGKGLV